MAFATRPGIMSVPHTPMLTNSCTDLRYALGLTTGSGVKTWPNGEIPYRFNYNFSGHYKTKSVIILALDDINSKNLPIYVREKTNEDANYVEFLYVECNEFYGRSNIGCTGGEQKIEIAGGISDEVTKGVVKHEIMHALGFEHEQNRFDRDVFLEVNCSDFNYSDNTAIPIGPYDPGSIMHYQCDGKKLIPKNPNDAKKYQRRDFSDLDKKAIRYIYGKETCTFELFGRDRYPQTYYECITCYGENTNYGCCVYCAKYHHKYHKLEEHFANRNVSFYCDCGQLNHNIELCTAASTRDERVIQNYYICYDCFDIDLYRKTNKHATPIICVPCAKKCHEGHKLSKMFNGRAYCDCGRICCRKSCLLNNPLACNNNNNSQIYYECLTCYGTNSDYGCCVFCALNHHKGHELAKRNEDSNETNSYTLYCDCGQVRHEIGRCTASTKRKQFVNQNFYICYDCFDVENYRSTNNAEPIICYPCAKQCHKGHRLSKMINGKAFCDCGRICCKQACRVGNPLACSRSGNLTNESFVSDQNNLIYYQCITCYGTNSGYGCCAYCATNHHIGHILIKRNVEHTESHSHMFYCDCGLASHVIGSCTAASTEKKYVEQNYFICYDCFDVEAYRNRNGVAPCICYPCAKHCHNGHKLSKIIHGKAFCDCGTLCCKKLCLAGSPLSTLQFESDCRA